jgi:hypothetical protein
LANGKKILNGGIPVWLRDPRNLVGGVLLVVGGLAGFSVDSITGLRNVVPQVDEITTQLVVQSRADSVSVRERWLALVGIQYLICSDSIPHTSAALNSSGCQEILRFAPELKDPTIPLPPAPRVWRPATR